MQPELINVLIVEDDEIDAEGIVRAFRRERIVNPTTIAVDGREALERLRGENGHRPFPRPCIVLLDLNMPRMNGLEVLEAIRGDPALQDMVVFVLTTSSSEEDRVAAYRKNVAGYMVKSDVGPSFRKAVSMLDHYWAAVSLPS